MSSDAYQVFISYARKNRSFAEDLYEYLLNSGFNPWIDVRKILAGQNWAFEIQKALDRSAFIIVIISKESVDHRGYAQKEIKIALDKFQEKLIDDIFLIPVIIDDDINIPAQFADIHCIYSSNFKFKELISEALNHQVQRLGGEKKSIQSAKDVIWKSSVYKDSWDGLPGYISEVEILDFNSEKYNGIEIISKIIDGKMYEYVVEARRAKFDQSPELYSFADDVWQRTNTFDAFCGDPIFCGSVMSLNYNIIYYNGGAAHPNHGFYSFSFVLGPMIQISSLSQVFSEPEVVLRQIQDSVVELLKNAKDDESADNDASHISYREMFDEKWIREGLEDWEAFRSFIFSEDGLILSFGSYQVAPYAAGTPYVIIPYRNLYKFMKRDYVQALQLPIYEYEKVMT